MFTNLINMEDSIKGTCLLMCPTEELVLREAEGLLHRLEVIDDNAKSRLPKADPDKTIKCFSRSAAGYAIQATHSLRPGPVLLKTVAYLMSEIAPREDVRRLDVYEFITDRLRAVRQDMTIQRLQSDTCIQLLEPMIRFYILFGYLLSNHPKFDSHLNHIHLQECFGKILDCYESQPEMINNKILIIFMCSSIKYPEMVVKRLSYLKREMNFDVLVAATAGNFIKMTRLALRLDLISRAALSCHIPNLRATALRNLCVSMSSTNSPFMINRLTSALSYNSTQDAMDDCRRLGIKCSNDYCYFNKKELVSSPAALVAQKWWTVDDDLQASSICQLLLN